MNSQFLYMVELEQLQISRFAADTYDVEPWR
jgi:hypothetical protein